MGDSIIKFYRERVKKEYKVAFVIAIILSLAVHIYKFTNTLPNHDSLYNYYSDQNVLGSGRWALSLSCMISSFHDLPWVNGLLSCIYMALTMVVIVALFKLKNYIVIGLASALIIASPSTTETFFFLFTADGYMLAMLLAALAVYFSRLEEKRVSRWIISAVLICISCGIYQAYVSFALILAVCYFIDILFQNKYTKSECLKWVVRQVIIYAAALIAYYLIWKICMFVTGTEANNYQGISEVGKVTPELLLGGISRAIQSVSIYFLQWNIFKNGATLYSVLNIMVWVVFLIGIIISTIASRVYERKWALLLTMLGLCAVIPFACIWHFVSDSVGYRAMMLQSLNILFILAAVLYERWGKNLTKNLVGVLLTVLVINNALVANISYFYLDLSYERTYAEGVDMMIEIRNLQDEYDVEDIAIIGRRTHEVQWDFMDRNTGEIAPAGKIHILSSLIESNLLIDHEHTFLFLVATFGLELESASAIKRQELSENPIVAEMECWPKRDSIAVIDNTIVIKLANCGEE